MGRKQLLVLALVAMVVLAGCSGGDDATAEIDATTSTTTTTTTAAPTTTTTTTTTTATPTTTTATESVSVRIVYDGEWQGSLSIITEDGSSKSKSISGSGTTTIPIEGNPSIVTANAQKQADNSATLTVQIIRNGEVVAESTTTAGYGLAQVSKTL